MPFKIRTKLLTAFIGLITVTIGITGGIVYYNQEDLHRSIRKFSDLSHKMHTVHTLQLAVGRALMPGNDYIITGDKKYIKEFEKASADVDGLLKKVDDILDHPGPGFFETGEEMEILGDFKSAWANIKDISLKIFALRDPTGRDAPAGRLYMDEMDYRWAYPAIDGLRRWSETDMKEHEEVREDVERRWRRSWYLMGVGAFLLLAFGVSFALSWSRHFVRPIMTIHNGADAIAKGDLSKRVDIKTRDELEHLADAMNDMAARLQIAHSSLESQVEIRTEELRAANEDLRAANQELQAAYSQSEILTAELEETSEICSSANEELKSLEGLKTEFLQTVSHELRSPLTPILGYLEMMRDGDIGELTAKQKEVVEDMHLCGKNMQMVVDELLEVASIRAGKLSLEFEDVDLQPVLWQAVKGIRKYADDNHIRVETRFPSDPLWVVGDKHSLAEIFTHLVRNAVKFNREKGRVEVGAKVKDNGVEIRVSDTGIGIHKDKLDRIYEAFYQVESSSARHYEGVGLGLYLVKRLVDIHSGEIAVKSEVGSGTTFTVFIPRERSTRTIGHKEG